MAPVLGFADWELPYILHTDASLTGLGAALFQMQAGHLCVIAYASNGLGPTEQNHPGHTLESLMLKWASHQWLAAIAIYDFTVKYKSNTLNADADGLSRRPHDAEMEAIVLRNFRRGFLKRYLWATPEVEKWNQLRKWHVVQCVRNTWFSQWHMREMIPVQSAQH